MKIKTNLYFIMKLPIKNVSHMLILNILKIYNYLY